MSEQYNVSDGDVSPPHPFHLEAIFANPGVGQPMEYLVRGLPAPATAQAMWILAEGLPEMLRRFLNKNRKYKNVDNHLGPRGVFPDINRKIGILESRIWDGDDVVGEPTPEVIDDMIGHLLLMKYMLDLEEHGDA